MKRFSYFVLFVCFVHTIASGQLHIHGSIVDRQTLEKLPYVHIIVENMGLGTVSDGLGNFSFNVPERYASSKISFSYMGYKTSTVKIEAFGSSKKIHLEPANNEIGEIIIMPDSTLLTMLRRAYKNIPLNYPTTPTKLKGFYRVTSKTENDFYFYFSEAIIETYKTSYKRKGSHGQVKILKSHVDIAPEADTIGTVNFYGGAFTASESDFVYRRYSFLNPPDFKHYQYSLSGISTYGNQPVYVVDFEEKEGAKEQNYKGRFYIEKASLAYIHFDVEATEKKMKALNKTNLGRYNTSSSRTAVSYSKHNGKWHLSNIQSFRKAYGTPFDKYVYSSSEFITTKIFTDSVKPIPLTEQIQYFSSFVEKAQERVDENYWEGYNIISYDSVLKKQIALRYENANKLSETKAKSTTKQKVFKALSDLGIEYNLVSFPLTSVDNVFASSIDVDNSVLSFNNSSAPIKAAVGLNMMYFYNLNNRWELSYASSSGNSNKLIAEMHDVGGSCNLIINKKRKPINFKMSLFYTQAFFANNFVVQNSETFSIDGKKFDSKKIHIGIGSKVQGIKPQLGVYLNSHRKFILKISCGYLYTINKNDMLFIREKSLIQLNPKQKNIPLNEDSVKLEINGVSTQNSNLQIGNLFATIGFSLKI